MKFKSFVLLLVLFSSLEVFAQSTWVYMFGPMLHLNISKKVTASFGLELAYWNYEHFPYSFDCGLEFERKKIRLYSEAQTGIGLAGISAGPVAEFRTDSSSFHLGFQSSVWCNYFLGFDVRYRGIARTSYICPGTYFKLPIVYGNENGVIHHSSSNSGSDWDWDD